MNRLALVADDHRVVAEGVSALLRRLDWDVDVAFSGNELLSSLKRHRYEVAVVDVYMPDMDGPAAIAAARSMGVATRFLLMSADESKELPSVARSCGALGLLTKAMAAEELEVAIEKVAAGAPYFPKAESTRPSIPIHEQVTQRQWQIVELLAEGLTAKQVAAHLDVSVRTIECHKWAVMQVCSASNFLSALLVLRENGLLSLDGHRLARSNRERQALVTPSHARIRGR